MNRRQFLTRAIASVPAIAVGAELLELLAPTRTIFLPPRAGWPVEGLTLAKLRAARAYMDAMDLASGPDQTVFVTIFDNHYVYLDQNSFIGDFEPDDFGPRAYAKA